MVETSPPSAGSVGLIPGQGAVISHTHTKGRDAVQMAPYLGIFS